MPNGLPLSLDAAQAVVARAKAAQPAWAARPLDERIALVKAGVAKLNEMKDVLVEELAWQMGRPTRYGGEFGGVNDRTDYMSDIAADGAGADGGRSTATGSSGASRASRWASSSSSRRGTTPT